MAGIISYLLFNAKKKEKKPLKVFYLRYNEILNIYFLRGGSKMNNNFKEKSVLFYIDIFEGEVKQAKFIEQETQGIWIKIDSEVVNTFIFEDKVDSRVFFDETIATVALAEYRKTFKADLIKENKFIEDVLSRLSKTQGKLYMGIIEEIMKEKLT